MTKNLIKYFYVLVYAVFTSSCSISHFGVSESKSSKKIITVASETKIDVNLVYRLSNVESDFLKFNGIPMLIGSMQIYDSLGNAYSNFNVSEEKYSSMSPDSINRFCQGRVESLAQTYANGEMIFMNNSLPTFQERYGHVRSLGNNKNLAISDFGKAYTVIFVWSANYKRSLKKAKERGDLIQSSRSNDTELVYLNVDFWEINEE